MEYHEAANFLFGLRRYPSRTGLEPTRRLLEHLGTPQESFRVVQVAGSNGKGSTARMVESVLREAGYDVGLFTSPHLDDLRERVRVDGQPVSKAAVREYVGEVEQYATEGAAEGWAPTFFEATTGLAAWAFDRAEVDVGVFEVGIGGRHDATSALSAAAAAVTNVGLEHTDVLGETVPDIARDMAGVAPEGTPLVTAATGEGLAELEAATDELLRVGRESAADVVVADRGRTGVEQAVTVDGSGWRVETRLPLLGSHQAENAGVAAALARQAGDVSTTALARGLRNAHWPGRFEVMGRDPLVVLDGAHNPGSCETVAATLAAFEYDDLHLVFGAMSDKDHAGMVEALPAPEYLYTCRPSLDRAESPAVLASAFGDRAGSVRTGAAVEDALAAALSAADGSDAVVVCGSLFAVAEARRRWTRKGVPKRVPDAERAAAALEAADVPGATVRRARESAVHRVVTVRVAPEQATRLERELVALGGECATSGVDADRELVDVVLAGTRTQFRRLLGTLADAPGGLAGVGEELGRRLGVDSGGPAGPADYPWEGPGTAVMGILNVTPDSFHDGGRYEAREDAVARGERMVEAGADILDVGGESTRPGADPVPVEEEIDRVVPVVEALSEFDALVSVDTRKADVARAALEAGADILNDVSGLEDPEMRLVAADHDVPVVVMHSIETPVDPEVDVEYDDVVADTIDALTERVLLAEKAGLDRSQILVDPGLGFGKAADESFELLGRVGEFRALGCPVLVGHSRKSMFGLVGREDSEDRLPATVAATALAADRGGDVVRVHDVPENVAAVRTVLAADDPEGFEP